MPTQKNKIIKEVAPKSVFPDMSALISTALTHTQGNFLVLDTTNHLIKEVASGELGTNFLGISQTSIISGVPVSPYQGTDVDGQQSVPALQGPVYGVTALVILKTGDVANPGDKVYIDDTAKRGVTTTAGSLKAIGIYQGPAVTAAAGQEIEVLIGAQYPAAALVF